MCGRAVSRRLSWTSRVCWRRSEAYRKARQFQKVLDDCAKLDLLLFVEVASESAPLKAGAKLMITVCQGQEVRVISTKGDRLWGEAVLNIGEVLKGWIDQKHVK
jgi:hypothetical protein